MASPGISMALVQYASAPADETDTKLKLSTALAADNTTKSRPGRRANRRNPVSFLATTRDSLIANSSRAYQFGPTNRDTSKLIREVIFVKVRPS
jgi:hypothetical protein